MLGARKWGFEIAETTRSLSRESGKMPLLLADAVFPDPGAQDFGHDDAAVGLLIVFENGDDGPRDGDRRAVERVCELRPFGLGRLEANRQPARLIVGAVRGRGDLAVF